MKSLFSFLTLAVLLSCNVKNSQDQPNKDVPVVKGKLYLQSSIVGGLSMSWLWLGDDGSFVKDPVSGADPVNYAYERDNNADKVGHYTKEGNNIKAIYESGVNETWAVEYDGNRLNTIDGLFSMEAEPMPEDYKITGSYTAKTFYANVGNISTFNFKDDGTFTLEGQGFVRTEDTGGNAKAATGGTYNITGNTLRLHFNNGETSVSVIGMYKAGDSHFLVINRSYFGEGK